MLTNMKCVQWGLRITFNKLRHLYCRGIYHGFITAMIVTYQSFYAKSTCHVKVLNSATRCFIFGSDLRVLLCFCFVFNNLEGLLKLA